MHGQLTKTENYLAFKAFIPASQVLEDGSLAPHLCGMRAAANSDLLPMMASPITNQKVSEDCR